MGVGKDMECSFDDEFGFEIEREQARFQGVEQQGLCRVNFPL
jgi:hypothetical protein